MGPSSLAYVGVESPAYQAWNEFGPQVLGCGLAEPGADGAVRLQIDDRHHRIAIHPGSRHRLAYLGWEYADERALSAAVSSVEAKGFEVVSATNDECVDRGVGELVYFVDPLGFRQELAAGVLEIPRSFHPPRSFGGFVTGSMGMGHVGVAVDDVAAAKAFYRDILGLRVTDEVDLGDGRRAAFMRCNTRHHSLALTPRPGMRGLHHIMVEVAELDDVGVALDECRRHDVPIMLSLGRHHNDRMVSFYMRTPSGFELEYGWGGLRVDDDEWIATLTRRQELWGHELMDRTPQETLEPCS